MDIQTLTCPSCGASLSVPRGASRVTCDYCGNTLGVTLSGKGATLELVQQVAETVAASGESTRSAIEDASQVTQAELRRLQLTQELTATQLQLTNIRGEIRALEREKSTRKIRQQLQDLRQQEKRLKEKILKLHQRLNPSKKTTSAPRRKKKKKKSNTGGCLAIIAILIFLLAFAELSTFVSTSGETYGMFPIWSAILATMLLWGIFRKAGRSGWNAFIPIYNLIVLLEIVGRPWWWIFLLLIPVVNIVILAVLMVDLAKSFGQGIGFAIGLILLPIIFLPILAFGKREKYVGPAAAS